jgi:hypothetical protein
VAGIPVAKHRPAQEIIQFDVTIPRSGEARHFAGCSKVFYR